MRKEIVLAIIGGGLFGLVLAFGFWRINSSLKSRDKTTTPTQTSQNQTTSTISLAEPNENDVVGQSPIKLSGITKPNSLVVTSGEEDDYLTRADNKGAFNEEVALVGGVNRIVLTAFDKDGDESQITLTVIYSTEFSKLNDASPPSLEESADSIRQKVQQKVTDALNSPTSYLGPVTDISESTIQLKSANGEIKQISVDNETVVIKEGKTSKEVKLSDIAIGDFIVAMGFRNGNHVLSARRILISAPLPDLKRNTVMAKVTKIAKSTLTLETIKDKKNITLTATGDTLVFAMNQDKIVKSKYSVIKIDAEIIAVGARSIFVLNTP